MTNDIITNLHPDNDPNTNLYPNIKKENIPSKSISTDKLDYNVLSLIGSLKPSGTDTSTNILAYTSNKGIYVATDNGHWYYWNGSAYADGGVYQSSEDIEKLKEDLDEISNNVFMYVTEHFTSELQNGYYSGDNILYHPSIACAVNFADVPITETIKYINSDYKYQIYWYNFETSAWMTNGIDKTSDLPLTGFAQWAKDGNLRVKFQIKKADESHYDFSNMKLSDIISLKTENSFDGHHIKDGSIDKNKLSFSYDDTFIIEKSSYYHSLVYDFKVGTQYKITVIDITSSTKEVIFYGLKDKNDTSKSLWQFKTELNKPFLWTPTHNFEALYYGVNGSVTIKVEFMDGIFSQLQHIFYCGKNRALKTLKDGIEKAEEYMNSVLYVDDGIYDLIEEFGSEYFESLTSTSTMSGLKLKNRIHIVFSSNSKVVCHYNGTNDNVKTLFSPFNAFENGFTLENLTLECSNVRYAIHDERNGSTEECQSIYKNCNISLDNSNNQAWKGATCIGGGLGSNHYVDIQNCIFTANRLDGYGAYNVGVYYHQSNNLENPSHRGTINIANCYFTNCIVKFQFSRTDAEEDTIIKVNGNSMYPFDGSDEQGVYVSEMTGTKFKLYEWGNEIRN